MIKKFIISIFLICTNGCSVFETGTDTGANNDTNTNIDKNKGLPEIEYFVAKNDAGSSLLLFGISIPTQYSDLSLDKIYFTDIENKSEFTFSEKNIAIKNSEVIENIAVPEGEVGSIENIKISDYITISFAQDLLDIPFNKHYIYFDMRDNVNNKVQISIDLFLWCEERYSDSSINICLKSLTI